MGWRWREEHMDLVLVPIGLLIMFGYHLFLLYRCLKYPLKTLIGYENDIKRDWVAKMMQVEAKDRGLALSVISNNISATNSLSSICLVLGSLMGAWIGNSSKNILTSNLIYGDTSPSIISIKHMAILSCFLIAFASFVQTTRCFVHVSFLISMQNTDVLVSYVEETVIRGSTFWSIRMRALYFATTMLLWIFGPIPMFVCSVAMVGVLYKLDISSTPSRRFQNQTSHNVFNKNGEETKEGSRGYGSRTSSPHIDHSQQLQQFTNSIADVSLASQLPTS